MPSTAKRSQPSRPHRRLIIIGGREDKEGDMEILQELARQTGPSKLVISTVASRSASGELWQQYQALFTQLGVKKVEHLRIDRRAKALDPTYSRLLSGAKAFFFTGGDQSRITSEMDGTPFIDIVHEIYEKGGVIAGTSAGAAVMGEMMLVGDPVDWSIERDESVSMAPGLGFLKNVIIDQHFAERRRIGRLLGAVAKSPRYLGIGIDENTAVLVQDGKCFRVFGEGSVYVVDAHEATDPNLSDLSPSKALSLFHIKLHVLSRNDSFDLDTRQPHRTKRPAASPGSRRPGRAVKPAPEMAASL
jgi:cyanophycinase